MVVGQTQRRRNGHIRLGRAARGIVGRSCPNDLRSRSGLWPHRLKTGFPCRAVFYFRFRGAVLCWWGYSDARARRCFGGQTNRASSLADVCCLFHSRRFVFPRTAKSNAREYSRIEAAPRAATLDINSVDLLAVSNVVHEDVQVQTNHQTGDYPFIASVVFLCYTSCNRRFRFSCALFCERLPPNYST